MRFHRYVGLLLLSAIVAACGGGGGSSSTGANPSTVAVTVAPTSASVAIGASKPFSATVTNASNTGVTWQVNGATGGNATVGTISTSGVYSAPASMPSTATVAVMAVSNADPTRTAPATVTITPSAPTVPTGLAATATSSTQVNLSWVASAETGGVVSGYLIERCSGVSCTNFAQIGTSTTTTYSDTVLSAATSYSYQVQATDAAGNLSADSSIVSVTTSNGSASSSSSSSGGGSSSGGRSSSSGGSSSSGSSS